MPFKPGNNANPYGRPKRYWITEKQRVVQARKAFKTMCEIRDGRVQEQKIDEDGNAVSVAASIKDVLTASIKIMAYAVGEPTRQVELTGRDGAPIETVDRSALIELSKNPQALDLARQLTNIQISQAAHVNGNNNGVG